MMLTVLLAMAATTSAHAKKPDPFDLTAGVQLGFGDGLGAEEVNAYGLTGSAHLGATIRVVLPWYVGLRGDLFAGSALDGFSLNDIDYDISQNASQLNAEFGIEPHLGPLYVRPTLGLGAARVASRLCLAGSEDAGTCERNSESGFSGTLNLQVGLRFIKHLEVTGFARANLVAGQFAIDIANTSYTLGAGLGVRY